MGAADHQEELAHAVGEGRRRPHGHQSVHVGGLFEQTAEAVYEEFLVHYHHQPGQQQFMQAGGGGVFQKGGDRPPGHGVAHGHIHQGEKQAETDNEPQADGLPLPGVLLGSCPRRCLPLIRWGRAVARLPDRLTDALRGGGGGVLHPHGVGQQAHRHGFHPGQGGDYLLHPGGAGGAAHTSHMETLHGRPPLC